MQFTSHSHREKRHNWWHLGWRQLLWALCASAVVWSFWMLRWSCRKSGCAGCLSGSISVGGVVGWRWEGSNAFSRVLIASVCRVRVHWVQTGALTIWRVSHTPHRQQCSGVRRSCWEMSQPLETAQPRLQQQQLCRPAEPRSTTICCWNTSRPFFFLLDLHLLQLEMHYIRHLFTCQRLRMTHQKKHHISLCGNACWLSTLVSFGLCMETHFNVVYLNLYLTYLTHIQDV